MTHCTVCSAELAPGAKFCSNCGSQVHEPVPPTCPSCGTVARLGARFCAHCGSLLQEPPPPPPSEPGSSANGLEQAPPFTAIPQEKLPIASESAPYAGAYERRLVTILFTDVIGFSTLSEHRDPEEMVDIMRGAYPAMLEPIQHHGGTVVQVMGDGALAFFGAPVAHEDDPERAVRAGLDIAAAIRHYAESLQKQSGIPNFNVRVGIHTGLVVVGDLGRNRHLEYTAIGDAVNLAARLQQNAPPGCVLISHETYRHVRGLFVVQSQEPLSVKGREQSVQAYLVQAVKPFTWRLRTRGVEGIATRLVGRDPELLALQNYYHDALEESQSRFTLIIGDPGIGKSRLVDEFADWVDLHPSEVYYFRGQATAASSSVPFSLLRDLFSYRFDILESDKPAQALEKFRLGMADFLSPDQADLVGQLIGFDFSTSQAVARLLGNPSFAQMASIYLMRYFQSLALSPSLVLLEDLHWADESSLDLVIQVITQLQSTGNGHLLIVGTTRPALFERRPNLGEGLAGFTRLKLAPLTRRASRELVQEILKYAPQVPNELVEQIIDEAEGSPFFIEELIKMLIEETVIQTEDEPWQINMERLRQLHVPPTLAGILQVRLDSLPPLERSVLQKASVVGRIFWDLLISDMMEEPSEKVQVEGVLAKLRERELIYNRERSSIGGVKEYLFKHTLLRDVTYETVLLKQRRQLHTQIATWIEGNAGERLNEYLALIARHWEQAGNELAAAGCYTRAGERALNLGIMREARSLFDQAVRLIPPDQIEHRWRALLGRDEVLGALGEREARQADDQALLELAEITQDPARLAEVYHRLGFQTHMTGNDRLAVEYYAQGLQAAITARRSDIEAAILPLQMISYIRLGELSLAGELVKPALSLAETVNDETLRSRTLSNVCLYYTAIGDNARAASLTQEVIEINMRQGNRMGEIFGLTNLAFYSLLLGRFQEGQAALQRSLQLCRQLEMRRLLAYNLLNLALACWRLNQPAEALQALQDSQVELQALGDQSGLAYIQLYSGLIYEQAGDLPASCQAYTQAWEAFTHLETPTQAIEARAGQARLNLHQGNYALAYQFSEATWDYLETSNGQGLELPILAYLTCAEAFQACGEKERAEQVLAAAWKILQDGAERISDPEWRKSYLENVPEHQRLVQTFLATESSGE